MAATTQQIYRNNVVFLCVVCVLVLALVFTVGFYAEQRSLGKLALQTQAKMASTLIGKQDWYSRAESQEALQLLAANPDILLACVFDRQGKLLTTRMDYAPKEELGKTRCVDFAKEKDRSSLPYSIVSAPIVQAQFSEKVGEIVLVGRAPAFFDRAIIWLPFCLFFAVAISLFCWLLGIRFRHILLKPLRQISSTAQRVSLYKDYTLRVVPGALDVVPQEVHLLTESFNAMLKEIEDRDSRLSRKSTELNRARTAAESANQAKSQFLANVSHELRTPLNAIIGFSAILADQQFGPLGNEKYTEYAKDIQDSGKHLLDVINDILDLTKAENGQLSVNFNSLNLTKIIEKAMRIIAGHAHARRIDIYTDLPEKLPKIIADPVRLVQILLNLLSNAIKFSPEGSKVYVRARAEPARQGIYYFTLTVEDSGIGMSESEIRKAFLSFNQADAGLNRKYEGAGLGLPLTKRLVELHHGKIKIESTEGQGTIVTVRLTSDPALLD